MSIDLTPSPVDDRAHEGPPQSQTSVIPAIVRRRSLDDSRTTARLIGALFLAGFAFYGIGFALVGSVTGDAGFIDAMPAHQTTLVLGAFLMLLNTLVDIGKGVLFFPILERHGKRTALVYLSALVAQVVLLDIGALFLLMLVPLGRIAADAGPSGATWAPELATLLTESNTIAYNVGQATLCFGGVFLCLLLLRTRLIPRVLAGIGIAGYLLHAVGSSAELFGVSVGSVLVVPGGLFELGLAGWLVVKGFQATAAGVHPRSVPIDHRSTGSVVEIVHPDVVTSAQR